MIQEKISLENMIIRPATREDVPRLVKIHEECFPYDARNNTDREAIWMNKLGVKEQGYPKIFYTFVAEVGHELIGYIFWWETGGIREKAILELEQIGVPTNYRGKSVGTKLIDESIERINEGLLTDERSLQKILVKTGEGNKAQELYKKTLGARIVGKIPDLYADTEANQNEIILMAKLDDINSARMARGLKPLPTYKTHNEARSTAPQNPNTIKELAEELKTTLSELRQELRGLINS